MEDVVDPDGGIDENETNGGDGGLLDTVDTRGNGVILSVGKEVI